MSKRASTTLIGGFILGALVLATLTVIMFGGQNFFRQKEQVIMYFSESVYGLNEGAPVNIRGVQVGIVKKINIIFNTSTGDFRVPVLVDLNPGAIAQARQLDLGSDEDPIKVLIENLGLRGQLQIQSILTSQLYIELGYHPGSAIHYYGDGNILEVPTIPSKIARINKVLDKVALDRVVEDAVSAISAINRFVNTREFADTSTNLQAALNSMRDASSDVGELAQELREKITVFNDNSASTMTEIRRLAGVMDESFANVNRVLGKDSQQLAKINHTLEELSRAARVISELEDSPERYQLEKALKDLRAAAQGFRELTQTIETNPQSLIWGRQEEEK